MIDWNTIDTVLLDMDGTLLDLHFDNYFWQEFVPQRYAEKQGITLEKAKIDLEPRFTDIYGKLQWYCLDHWAKELDLDIMAMKREVTHLISFRPHAEAFLQNIKDHGKQVIMITNAHRGSLSLKLEYLPMSHYFDKLISSHDYGYPKENPAFWQALEADINLNKERALFIDDNVSILDSAKTYGIAQLLAISHPDSKQGKWNTGSYNAVTDFRDLLAPETV
ncbi:GMP/IMP nucleotidase [uncultured Endozoicomonas sp.]|uniref:GMP/IMP nucleotidase n=1 Tax=uncultured Endozoicomonas sp. TaxID=432652 RepID=UPI002611E6F6|nr:GMP/IMP nucleotidase [uncultured Endozoicomonas sp.]